MKKSNNSEVGPVLISGEMTTKIVKAMQFLNPNLTIKDYGSYVRVTASDTCHLTKAAIENELGHEFEFPNDLELIMPSFKGFLTIDHEQATWTLEPQGVKSEKR